MMEETERNDQKENKKKKFHPRTRANLLSHWFFCWELPFFYKGYKKQITESDLYGPLKDHRSNLLGDKLEEAWLSEVKLNKNPSLWRPLVKVFGFEFFLYGLALIPIELITRLCQPILIGRLLSYFTPNQTEISVEEAYFYASAIIIASFLYVIIGHSYFLGVGHLGMKIRVAVSSLVYRKSLKLSQNSLQESTVGQVVNLLSNDVARFDRSCLTAHYLWMGPLETLIILGLLYWMLGATALVGIGVFFGAVAIQAYLSKKISEYRMRVALKTDNRVRLMNEIVSGIKIIKMYTWERPFAQLIEKARKLEMDQIKVVGYLHGGNISCSNFLSRTAIFACIVVNIFTGGNLDPEYVYVLTSFYEIIRLGVVIFLPIAMMTFGETVTSVKRINEFLTKPEIHNKIQSNHDGVKMESVSVKWDQTADNTLSDITLTIEPNRLVALIGPVGSGKTTLLQTILKEVSVVEGCLQVSGTISYAPQQPWLFTGSIRDNILFGEDFDKVRYEKVIKVCALEHDFSILPFGDKTLVGERGVMLSGGQKARINLARAVYKKADLYLLDDPLSAVDANVGYQLFNNCIKNYLRKKTTVLVTHQLQYLGGADVIYLLENGRISIGGTYQELSGTNNEFLKLLQNAQRKNIEDRVESEVTKLGEENPEEVKENQQEGSVSGRVYLDYFLSGGTCLVGTVVIILLGLAQAIGNGGDYFLSFWVNLEQDRTPNEILTRDDCFYIYTGLTLLLIFMCIISSLMFFRFCITTSTNLHNKMFRKIIHSTMRFFNTNPSGRILNRFSRDINLLDESLPLSMIDTIDVGFNVIAIVVLLSVINFWILIPTIFMFALFYYYRIIFLASSRNLKRIEGKTRSPMYTHVTTSLEGLATIRAFNAQTRLEQQFDKHQDLHSSSFYMFLACDGAFGFWLDFTCVIYLGIVTLSFLFIGSETSANVGLSITQSIMMTGLLQWGMKQSGQLENEMTSVERVVEYTKLESESNTGTKIVTKEWPSEGKIEFQEVSLQYSSEDPLVLKHLTFEILPKEKIGIVGRTGAGKSSLVSVVFRLVPTEGTVLIDGVDTRTLPLDTLRTKISIIPQEPVLFAGTIRYNLDPFDEYLDQQLWNALEEVELKSVVSALPGGLSSKVSESGSNFSIGQRQLLCLARAVVRMNKILILDEATANVDPQTDELIQETIRKKFRDCTVLTIAHRLNTVMDCDRILVMDDGCVAEFDQPQKLLQNEDGVFYRLVRQSGEKREV